MDGAAQGAAKGFAQELFHILPAYRGSLNEQGKARRVGAGGHALYARQVVKQVLQLIMLHPAMQALVALAASQK